MPADGPNSVTSDGVPPLRRNIVREFLARLRNGVISLCGLATVGLTVATVLGHFGSSLWLFDLLSHFRCQYVVLLFVCGGLLGLLRAWKTAGVAVLMGVWNLLLIAPLYRHQVHADAPPEWRLVSVNAFSRNQTPDELLRFLRDERPDAFVVVELTPDWAERLASLEGEYPYREFQDRSDNFGIGLYSRVPIVSAEFIPLAGDQPAIVARILKSGRELIVIGAHPVPPAGGRLSELRNQQLRQLGALAVELDDDVVLLGDLNTTPWSFSFQKLLERSELQDGRVGFGAKPSWPAGRPWLSIPIDHCLFSDGLSVLDFAIGPDVGSDHYPVVVRLGNRQASSEPEGSDVEQQF